MINPKKLKVQGAVADWADWERDNICLVTGLQEVQAIEDYLACFHVGGEERKGRFFRKLIQKGGRIVATKQKIGMLCIFYCY